MSEGKLIGLEQEKDDVQAKAARSHNVTIRLSCPVKFNSIEKSEITLRRITVGDQIEYNKNDDTQEATVNLIAKLAGVTVQEARTMDAVDMQICEAAISGFLSGRPPRDK